MSTPGTGCRVLTLTRRVGESHADSRVRRTNCRLRAECLNELILDRVPPSIVEDIYSFRQRICRLEVINAGIPELRKLLDQKRIQPHVRILDFDRSNFACFFSQSDILVERIIRAGGAGFQC